MEQNEHNDMLEELFRRSFSNQEKAEADGWNVPRAELWDNISAAVDNQALAGPGGRNTWKWLASIAAVLLLISFVRIWMYEREVDDLARLIQENKERVEAIEAEHHEAETAGGEREAGVAEVSAHDVRKLKEIPEMRLANRATGDSREGLSPESMSRAPEKSWQASAELESTKKDLGTSFANTAYLPLHPIQAEGTTLFDPATLRNQVQDIMPVLDRSSMDPDLPKVMRHRDRSLTIGLTTASQWTANIRNKPPPSQGPGGPSPLRVSSRYGRVLGVFVNKDLGNNWSFETGVWYTHSVVDGFQERRITYSIENETPDPSGGFSSTYRVKLEASEDEIESDVHFTRPGSLQLENGEKITLKFDTKERFEYIEVPMIGQYNFQTGRLGLAFRIGAVNRVLVSRSLDVDGIQPNEEIHLTSQARHAGHAGGRGHRRPLVKSMNAYSLFGLGGLQASYQLTPNWQLTLSPTVTRSITPIARRGINKKATIHKESIAVHGGVGYRF